MKLYLAGWWKRRSLIQKIAEELRALGHVITSRWLDDEHIKHSKPECAIIDIEDVRSAEGLVSFTEYESVGYNTGGRHVEFGIAIAKGLELFLVGPKENIFHHLYEVKQFDHFADFKEYLQDRGA